MALLVKKLNLTQYRNFTQHEVEFASGVTILTGPNAVGKTNTIEALQLITSGKSFRNSRPHELIYTGVQEARVAGRIEGDGRVLDIVCTLTKGKRAFSINGKKRQRQALFGILPSVLFCPDDLVFSKGTATWRRQEIDDFGSQVSLGYNKVLKAYSKAISQRNALLKQEIIQNELLDAWDESLSFGAAQLLYHRIRLIEKVKKQACIIYRDISGGEELTVEYVSQIQKASNKSKEELKELFYDAFQRAHTLDIRRQTTTVGPQRDDLKFIVDGKEARTYCSQGQQRSIVLAWKIAEVLCVQDILGTKPLLLLDDVMSELDKSRREEMVQYLINLGIQTIITTTNIDYFSHEFLKTAKVVTFNDEHA